MPNAREVDLAVALSIAVYVARRSGQSEANDGPEDNGGLSKAVEHVNVVGVVVVSRLAQEFGPTAIAHGIPWRPCDGELQE